MDEHDMYFAYLISSWVTRMYWYIVVRPWQPRVVRSIVSQVMLNEIKTDWLLSH